MVLFPDSEISPSLFQKDKVTGIEDWPLETSCKLLPVLSLLLTDSRRLGYDFSNCGHGVLCWQSPCLPGPWMLAEPPSTWVPKWPQEEEPHCLHLPEAIACARVLLLQVTLYEGLFVIAVGITLTYTPVSLRQGACFPSSLRVRYDLLGIFQFFIYILQWLEKRQSFLLPVMYHGEQ